MGGLHCKVSMGGLYCKLAMGGLHCKLAMGSLHCKLAMGSLHCKLAVGSLHCKLAMGGLFTYVNHCFTKQNLKERCYLHSVQQSYKKNSCKPGIKYFSSVNCWFTTCKPPLYCNPPLYVIRRFTKDHLLRIQQLFLV